MANEQLRNELTIGLLLGKRRPQRVLITALAIDQLLHQTQIISPQSGQCPVQLFSQSIVFLRNEIISQWNCVKSETAAILLLSLSSTCSS